MLFLLWWGLFLHSRAQLGQCGKGHSQGNQQFDWNGLFRTPATRAHIDSFNFQSIQLNPAASLAQKVMYDLFKQMPSHYPMRDWWRCVTMGCGVQSVLTLSPPPGVRRMLRQCVGSWDSVEPSTPYYKIRESTSLQYAVTCCLQLLGCRVVLAVCKDSMVDFINPWISYSLLPPLLLL